MENLEKEAEILQNLAEKGDNARVLEMTEKTECLGTVAVVIREKTLVIINFSLANACDFENLSMEETFYIDTLMRSAASYGETHGARKIETTNSEYNTFLKRRGFKTDETHAFTDMSTIVHYT